MLHTLSAATSSNGRKRARQQIAEIARPHLLDEGGGKTDLGAEQNVPEQNAADQHAGTLRDRACRAGKIFLQEAPSQHLQERPVDQLDEPDARASQQIGIAQHKRADAARRSEQSRLRQQHRLRAAMSWRRHPSAGLLLKHLLARALIANVVFGRGRAPRRETPPRACRGHRSRSAFSACRPRRCGRGREE